MTNEKKPEQTSISRRGFLKGLSAFIAASSIPVVAAGCETTASSQPLAPTSIPVESAYPEVPYAPAQPPNAALLRTFTPHEARTVEALTARILPGTPDDPGAREAGVVIYIDNLLAFHEGFNEKTYREPPYAEIYEGDEPPTAVEGDFQRIWVASDQIERYGTQAVLSPREVYRIGVMAVDNYARSKFGRRFVELGEVDQDNLITDLVEDTATGFEQFTSKSFFSVLRRHTAEGMFSDPAYGGNRNMVGWNLIGYPGAQRAYTEHDIRTEGTRRAPQALAQLSRFHAGEFAGEHVVLPVSGSTQEYPVHHDHP